VGSLCTAQALPFQCSMRVPPWYWLVAQALLAEVTATPFSSFQLVVFGVGYAVQPSQAVTETLADGRVTAAVAVALTATAVTEPARTSAEAKRNTKPKRNRATH
jgi:hypothetical protein